MSWSPAVDFVRVRGRQCRDASCSQRRAARALVPVPWLSWREGNASEAIRTPTSHASGEA